MLNALLWEDLARQIKDRQEVRQSNRLASRKDSKVPSTDNAEHTKATSDLEQVQNVRGISSGRGVGSSEIGGGDECEEHDQTEEYEGEEGVDAEGADEEGE